MYSLDPEQHTILSNRLNDLGLEGSAWKPAIMDRMVKDIKAQLDQGRDLDQVLNDFSGRFNADILVDLPKINPRQKSLKIYRFIRRIGQIGAIIMLGLSVIAFVFSLGVAVPLIMTGLFLFLFVVFPFTFLIRNIRDRTELVYSALFPGE